MTRASDDDKLQNFLAEADQIQSKLDRSIFHLRTLYEVSKDIYSHIDSERILQNFLLMTMGNYGVVQAFVSVVNAGDMRARNFVCRGIKGETPDAIRLSCHLWPAQIDLTKAIVVRDLCAIREQLPCALDRLFCFPIKDDWIGFLGLGAKIAGGEYDEKDQELIETLLCNLAGALRNAIAFEEINHLNAKLRKQNQTLEDTLNELRSSLRKIEILEGVKESLSKFVPLTVKRLIEKDPKERAFRNLRQDVSVLFLDIENYTLICNRIGSDEISKVIESHFSVFMNAIYANDGDVNETAGDGLMVLFLNEDPHTNTQAAVQTALQIRADAAKLIDDCPVLYKPLAINIGINSGEALVGAAKFDSFTGSRWTYTARGQVVNIAARIGALATNGGIYLSAASAARVKADFPIQYIGKHRLKNVPDVVDIYAL